MADNQNRLMIIDDESGILDFIRTAAENVGYDVLATSSADEFRNKLFDFNPTMIIVDLQMPESDGVEILRYLGEKRCGAAVIVASGMDARVLATAEQLGETNGLNMQGSLQKPFMLEDLERELLCRYVEPRTFGEQDLAAALKNGELAVYYQPKLKLGNDRDWHIGGLEALVRWHHQKYGLVLPDDFIPMAEETGLISELTDFVLLESLEQLKRWQEDGLDLKLSVNLAPQLVRDLEFPDRLMNVLEMLEIDPKLLTLEITESAAMKDPALAMDILTRLRVKEVSLAMDDFGTGYSSLTQLYQMPFNELKIDKSLVFEIPASREARTMVSSMVDLGHNLGLSVSAEGAESLEVLNFLAANGCDEVQGFYISRAVPADEIAEIVSAWRSDNNLSYLNESS